MNLSSMKKVLMIVPSYPPVSGSSVFRNCKFSKYLLEFGYLPCILSMSEKRGQKMDYGLLKEIPGQVRVYRAPAYNPISKIVDIISPIKKYFFKRFSKGKNDSNLIGPESYKTEAIDGGRAKKVKFFLKLVLWLCWFPEEDSGWIITGFIKGLWVIKKEKPQILFSSSPPISAHVIGLFLKKFTRLSWVIDIRDPFISDDHPSLEYKIIRNLHKWLEKLIFKNADAIIFNTKYMRAKYCDIYGLDIKEKSTVITNGVDPADFLNREEEKDNNIGGSLTIVHTGEFFRIGRLPDSLLKSIGELKKEGEISDADIRIIFMGGNEYKTWPNYQQIFNQYDLGTIVSFTEHVSHDEVIETLTSSDVLLLLQTHSKFATQIPAKVFEYIMVGKPILAIVTEGATKQLLEELLIHERDYWICNAKISEVKKCIVNCLSIKRTKGFHANLPSEYVLNKISRKNQTKKLAKLFKSLDK